MRNYSSETHASEHPRISELWTVTHNSAAPRLPYPRRLPRLVTPEQAAFEAYRKRRAQRNANQFQEEPQGNVPLGLDPAESVEGELVDLTAMMSDARRTEPTDAEIAEANASAEAMLRGENEPDDFGEGLDKLAGN
jgi:hypothetical protein